MKYKLFFIVNILTKLYHMQCYTYITDLIAEKLIFIYTKFIQKEDNPQEWLFLQDSLQY